MPQQSEATGGSWRDVTVRQYRSWTTWSSLVGVLLFAWGLWILTHGLIVRGLLLIAVGSAAALWTAALRIEGTPGPIYRPGQVAEAERWTPRVVHFYTRRACTLCHEARTRLAHDLEGRGLTIVDHDVDNDPVLAKRYGDRVPVAVYQGGEVFALKYDAAAVQALR